VDANGLYIYANPVVERILGYRPEELVGRTHFYDLLATETLAEHLRPLYPRMKVLYMSGNPEARESGHCAGSRHELYSKTIH
jgi:PAS domain S-box-containing protein